VQSPSPRPVRTPSARAQRRRHALLGVACGLGLVVAPLAGSAVVIGATAVGRPPAPPAQVAASAPVAPVDPVPAAQVPAPQVPAALNAVDGGRRGRSFR
jgi:hypothetical protein